MNECFCGLGMCGWSYWCIKVATFLYCINNTVSFFSLSGHLGWRMVYSCCQSVEELSRKLTAETVYLCMSTDLIRMGITGKSLSQSSPGREDEYTWRGSVPPSSTENVVTFIIKPKPYEGHYPNMCTLHISDKSADHYLIWRFLCVS